MTQTQGGKGKNVIHQWSKEDIKVNLSMPTKGTPALWTLLPLLEYPQHSSHERNTVLFRGENINGQWYHRRSKSHNLGYVQFHFMVLHNWSSRVRRASVWYWCDCYQRSDTRYIIQNHDDLNPIDVKERCSRILYESKGGVKSICGVGGAWNTKMTRGMWHGWFRRMERRGSSCGWGKGEVVSCIVVRKVVKGGLLK